LNERQRAKRGIPTGLRGMCRELLGLPGQPRETEKGRGVVLGVNFTGFHAMMQLLADDVSYQFYRHRLPENHRLSDQERTGAEDLSIRFVRH
jgi:hypothetical protein